MSHLPLNHRLIPLFRTLAALCGLYVLIFGIVAVVRTGGFDMFAQRGLPEALGLHANRAFAILSIVAGLILVVGAFIGRNLDQWINLVASIAFLVAGMAMMILLQTDLNFLGFTMTTCIVSFVIGLVLFTAGLYGRTGSAAEAAIEEEYRHGHRADPDDHPWTGDKDAHGSPATPDPRYA